MALNVKIDLKKDKLDLKLDLEKENIVFWETDSRLRSAVAFQQYVLANSRLTTLIGELHHQEFGCNASEISISEYAIQTIKRNPQSRVILELNPNQDPKTISSIPIREISAALPKNSPNSSRIIPFDYRAWFVGWDVNNDLYEHNLKGYQPQHIIDKLIMPLYTKWDKAFGIDVKDYDQGAYNYLDKYIKDIDAEFKRIVSILNTKQYDIVYLKDAWMKVTDFFIIRELFKNSDVNEYIIIAGESHRSNLTNILKSFRLINDQTGQSGDCVNLFKTYKVK